MSQFPHLGLMGRPKGIQAEPGRLPSKYELLFVSIIIFVPSWRHPYLSLPLSIFSLRGINPRPLGKVALFLQPGQTRTQPPRAGHSSRSRVHGPGAAGPGEALQRKGLSILPADGLQLDALNPGERLA